MQAFPFCEITQSRFLTFPYLLNSTCNGLASLFISFFLAKVAHGIDCEKSILNTAGIELMTFRFLVRLFFHRATGHSRELGYKLGISGTCTQYALLVKIIQRSFTSHKQNQSLTINRTKLKLQTNLGIFLPIPMKGSSTLVMGFNRVSEVAASYSGRGCSLKTKIGIIKTLFQERGKHVSLPCIFYYFYYDQLSQTEEAVWPSG